MRSSLDDANSAKLDPKSEGGMDVVEAQVIVDKSALKKSSKWAIISSCVSLISDGYNIAIVGNVSIFLKALYPDAMSTQMKSRISSAFVVGQVVGLLGFGLLIDKIGRKRGGIMTAACFALGIALSAASNGTSHMGLLWMLVISRGLAGVGAGGEYPVCTTMAAEAADDAPNSKSWRGFLTAISTIVAIDLGFVLAGIIPMIILSITREQHYELVWRLSAGIGIIIPLAVFVFRFFMTASKTYEQYGSSTWKLPYALIVRKYWRAFIGTAGVWAMYNWTAVPFAIFTGTIASALNPTGSMVRDFGFSTLINVFAVPGGIVGGLIADRIGRKRTLILGFVLQGIMGFVIAGAIRPIQTVPVLFLVLYGVFLFLGEMGPGSTVFIIAAESYPTVIRGVMIGLSGAVAKAAGSISTQVFNPILELWPDDEVKGQQTVFLIGSAFCMVGAIIAVFFVRDLRPEEDLEAVDREYKRYLEQNGH
ncbi:MFS general substrate transporter [Thozetella sp. PMI_491]|nr:MFS general substrate transporter [Thozetella sp. PMI_491]